MEADPLSEDWNKTENDPWVNFDDAFLSPISYADLTKIAFGCESNVIAVTTVGYGPNYGPAYY